MALFVGRYGSSLLDPTLSNWAWPCSQKKKVQPSSRWTCRSQEHQHIPAGLTWIFNNQSVGEYDFVLEGGRRWGSIGVMVWKKGKYITIQSKQPVTSQKCNRWQEIPGVVRYKDHSCLSLREPSVTVMVVVQRGGGVEVDASGSVFVIVGGDRGGLLHT